MTDVPASTKALPDFIGLHNRYQKLADKDGSFRSQLGKRVGTPEDLGSRPAFYRLFPGEYPPAWGDRIVFFLPFCRHSEDGKSLGAQLAAKKISEMRLFQVIRAEYPNDLIQLRRLVQNIEPVSVNWKEFGKMLYDWSNRFPDSRERAKRRLLEDFFVHLPAKTK